MGLGLLLLISFFVLVLLNVPIAVSIGLSTVIGLLANQDSLSIIATNSYAAINKHTLLAIPFFILTGLIMEKAGISGRLINFSRALMGSTRGSLAIVSVLSAVIFAAISGSGPATVAALGVILIPGMISRGYPEGMAAGLLSAAGSIGIIVPPSIAFIIYASLADVSVGAMFLAGVVPGLLLGICFVVVSVIMLISNPDVLPERHYSLKEKLLALRDAAWGLGAPVIILGGIYSGVFTPTESAGIAAVYGLFIGVVVYRTLTIRKIVDVLVSSASSTAVVMYIVVFATVFAWLLTTSGIASNLSSSLLSITDNKILILLLMNLVFLIAGFFLDTISAYYILLPVMLPVILQLEVDPIHFGIFMTLNLAIGQFTPPVGVNLFVASNVGRVSLEKTIVGVVPYIGVGLLAVLIVTFIPQISLYLPSLLGD